MKSTLLIVFTLSAHLLAFGQPKSVSAKHSAQSNPADIREIKTSSIPTFIKLDEGTRVNPSSFKSWLQTNLDLDQNIHFELVNTLKDELGFTHERYQQTYNGVNVRNAIWLVHSKNNEIVSMNGLIHRNIKNDFTFTISEPEGLTFALAHVGAEQYKWEVPEEEKHLKVEQKNENASYFPTGKKVLFESKNGNKSIFIPTYEYTIYAHSKLYRSNVYVNAKTGEIVHEESLIHDADVVGTAQTVYSGSKQITTDSFSGGYRLSESGRGVGIETRNMQQGTDYSASIDFTDANNIWNNVNAFGDEYATDVHYGAEMTYDYYSDIHNRNSIDDAGFQLVSYVHFDYQFGNAFWDGYRMTYGDGDGSTPPLTTLDICGHEITHGLTNLTANLNYAGESGGLNESFSDIFGTAIERFARPSDWDWIMGGDMGSASIRSLSNPNITQCPDTYEGNFWDPDLEVHNISGVQNYWFYLLSQGGSGTNDNGSSFSVSGIGVENAAKIAFRNLTVYLTPSSTYDDARFFSIISAQDLFGSCTPSVEATANAWYAVGLGAAYSPVTDAQFVVLDNEACSVPFVAQFQNYSTNGSSYLWNFGDGQTSTSLSPSHTYTSYGNYTVTLQANGGACGNDVLTISDAVSIQQTNVCFDILPTNATRTTQECVGLIYDSGGPSGPYTDNDNSSFLIQPAGATSVTLNFNYFDLEEEISCSYDGLIVYDGPNSSSPIIGIYCGGNNPPASVTSSGSSIYFEFYSDQSATGEGFEISWTCTSQSPVANFIANTLQTCDGIINFTDMSQYLPTSWNWDFGDGQTSTSQNPTHNYTTPGLYTVQLTVANANGSNTKTKINYIRVNDCLGVNDISLSELNIFPNPTTNNLIIKTGTINSKSIEIVDNLGRIVHFQNVSGSEFEINLENKVNEGSYLLLLRDNENNLIGKTRFVKI